MEAFSASSTAIMVSSSSSSPFAIFSPKKPLSSSKPLVRFPVASKGKDNDPDLQSDSNETNLVPVVDNPRLSLSPLSQDVAMGLVLSAATGRGWTTGSGMEGPPESAGDAEASRAKISTFPWSLFTKSPRRRMLVAFTCNICCQRTTRAVNPHAYTDGTVFVQCCGCNAYHKLVDNLNLFHDMKCYINPNFNYEANGGDVKFQYRDMDDEEEDGCFSM
ncbi:hypothetical protein V2J09_021289 [Rumex salicifolius]